MKRMGELMAELGFNKDASDSAKEAFVKYLMRVALKTEVIEGRATPPKKSSPEKQIDQRPQKKTGPEQLCFDLGPAAVLNKKMNIK